MNTIRRLNKMPSMLALLLWMVSQAASGQTADSVFTLKNSIEYSLIHNPSSTIYKNQVEIARQKNIEAVSTYLPQIAGSIALEYNPKLQTTVFPAGAFFPSDTKIKLGNPYAHNAVAQIDQKIYDQAAIAALEGRKVNRQLADLNVLKNNETLIYNTSTAYYQVLVYNEQEKLLRENEKQYTELLKILQLQYERGVIRKIDYDRTRVSLNNIVAQITLMQTNKKMALNQLKYSMGMPLENSLYVNDSSYSVTQADLPQSTDLNVENRLDYKIMNQNILSKEIDVKMKRGAFVPTLAAYARYGANAYGREFEQSFGTLYDYSTIGVKLSVPVFDGWKRNSQLHQSQLALINAKEDAKLSVQNYKLEYQNANTKLLSSYTSLNTNKANLDLAKEVFDATNLQYKQGTASLTDFLNADYSLKEAQSNYIRSLLDFMSSRLDFEKSQGTLSAYINQL